MGRLVKLLGSGVGMASEAISDCRSHPRSQSGRSASSEPTIASSSRELGDDGTPSEQTTGEISAGHNEETRWVSHERKQEYSDDEDDRSDDLGGQDDDDDDEAAWELDDMADRVAPPPYSANDMDAATDVEQSEESKIKKEERMIREMVAMAGPPPHPPQRLPCSVILPQRRPRNKDRGFVRAYAPVLESSGISQDVFMKFLRDWVVASKADPWIDVVFLSAGIVGFVPTTTTQIISTVVQVVAGAARELQSRQRRNTFLGRANQALFMPRGLYAMVMAFKDDVPGEQPGGPLSRLSGKLGVPLFTAQRLDIDQTVAQDSTDTQDSSRWTKGLRGFRLASGKTHGEIQLPEVAELVYPDLDRAVEHDLQSQAKDGGPEKLGFQEKWKGAGEWVQDYLDRRAQASYEQEHPGSKLAVPSSSRKAFSSRFADPTHPANSGSLVSLLTGGAVNTDMRRRARHALRPARRARNLASTSAGTRQAARHDEEAYGRSLREERRRKRRRQGALRKILQKDVLYLLVVNLPTDEEVQQSVADLERLVGGEAERG